MADPIRWFVENFGREPEPRPPMIPGPWRIPFFIALSVLSLAVLGLLIYYVVIPGVHAVQMPPAPAR